jgi:hypothetical protein
MFAGATANWSMLRPAGGADSRKDRRQMRIVALAVTAIALVGPMSLPAQGETPFSERWTNPVAAQQKPATQQTPTAQPKPATEQKLPVSLEQALYLIRSTLLTLNDANRSGNYTVLRELAAPDFQVKNSAADLGVIFADLRNRKVDLFAVALMAPQLSAAPHLEANGMLRLTGAFPTRPLQINFDLLFQNVGGQWRLFGLSVHTPQPQAAAH